MKKCTLLLSSNDRIVSAVESCVWLSAAVDGVQKSSSTGDFSLPLQEGTRSESVADYAMAGEGVYLFLSGVMVEGLLWCSNWPAGQWKQSSPFNSGPEAIRLYRQTVDVNVCLSE